MTIRPLGEIPAEPDLDEASSNAGVAFAWVTKTQPRERELVCLPAEGPHPLELSRTVETRQLSTTLRSAAGCVSSD